MSVEQSLVSSPSSNVPLGTPLKFDLRDSTGKLLQKAGTPIDERLLVLFREKGIRSLTAHGVASLGAAEIESVLLSSYPSASIATLKDVIGTTCESLISLVHSIKKDEECSAASVYAGVGQFAKQSRKDIATALAVIALRSQNIDPQIAARIATHSSKIAMLSIVMSIVQKDDPSVSCEIGLAGLLHDISLLLHSEWFSVEPNARYEALRIKYRRHSIESADILNGLNGISKNVLTMIAELHEQADGSGYPCGLTQEQMLPGSLILNVADAYVSLVDPIRGSPVAPSDVLAFLCYHVAQGKFCRVAMKALTQCMSMYPIGSVVVLDDQTNAVVIKANFASPLKPIVRSLQQGHAEIDLRESNRFITFPSKSSITGPIDRIKKSQMHEAVWRTDR